MVHLLLQMGADANTGTLIILIQNLISQECKMATPLFVCVLKGETEAVKHLLEFGADPNVLCTTRKISPLHLAASKGNFFTFPFSKTQESWKSANS
jgi:ankyrin repeat protein